MKNIIKFKRLVLLAVISCLILPAISFALVRGQDGYNYYDNNSPPVGGSVFGGSSFGGGSYCFGGSSYPTFCSVVDFFLSLIGRLIPILVSISVIVFAWGVFRYVIADGEDRGKSRNIMMYGIIGLFVMVSVWGLVALVTKTFNLENNNYYYYYGGGGMGRYGGYGSGGYGGSGGGTYGVGTNSGYGSGDNNSVSDNTDTTTDFPLPSIDNSIK